jgi:hypothetical protein
MRRHFRSLLAEIYKSNGMFIESLGMDAGYKITGMTMFFKFVQIVLYLELELTIYVTS